MIFANFESYAGTTIRVILDKISFIEFDKSRVNPDEGKIFTKITMDNRESVFVNHDEESFDFICNEAVKNALFFHINGTWVKIEISESKKARSICWNA